MDPVDAHGNCGLAAAGADVPDSGSVGSFGGDESEEFVRVTRASLDIKLGLLVEQISHS